jgi:hypothetical protein
VSTPPDPETSASARQALSSVMMAAAFVIEPEVWPGFVAFTERTTGKRLGAGPEVMDLAIEITDAIRRGLAQAAGHDPGIAYPSARRPGGGVVTTFLCGRPTVCPNGPDQHKWHPSCQPESRRR